MTTNPNSKKILLADNNQAFRNTLLERLKSEGYNDVKIADTPEKAKQLDKHHDFDLAIIDNRLRDDTDEQDNSGLELTRQLKPTLPKIILTLHPTFKATRDAYRLSMVGYFVKTVS